MVGPSGAVRAMRRELLALLVIVAVAAILRVWRLGVLPPGLHVDEAWNLLDVRAVLAGWRPAFLPANAGRDVLYTYLQAPLVAWLGESPATARLASAVIGTLTVAAAWGLARGLPVARPGRVALATAGFLALSYWHLHFSRFGIRAVLFPLVVTGAMWAWWRATDRGNRTAGAAGRPVLGASTLALGVLLGLAAYTHPAGRALALVPAADATFRLVLWRDGRPWRQLAVALALALVVAVPLLSVWVRHPDLLFGHAGEVSVLPGGPEAVLANAARVGAMFNLRGDLAPWRNLPGRPVFEPLTGILFLLGLVLAVRAARRGAVWASLALVWLVVLALPSVLTDGAPNFSRAIGVLPGLFLFPALALDHFAERLGGGRTVMRVQAANLVVVAVLALAGLTTARDYFGLWAESPATPLAFDADKVALARRADRRGAEGAGVYLSPAMAEHPTVRVSAREAPAGFDARFGLVVAPRGAAATEYLLLETEVEARRALDLRLAGTSGVVTIAREPAVGPEGPALVAYLAPAGEVGWLRAAAPRDYNRQTMVVDARFDGPRLVGSWGPYTVAAGETVTVTLLWESAGPTETDLNTFVHLVGAGGAGAGNGDGPPLGGSHPTTAWRPGELVLSEHALVVDAGAPPGPAELRVGWYDWRSGERRALTGADAGTAREDGTAAVAGPMRVRR